MMITEQFIQKRHICNSLLGFKSEIYFLCCTENIHFQFYITWDHTGILGC